MILANLAKAIREQNYYAVVLEFLIVIAGVVIGFQITAWNEQADNRDLEQLYLERILIDVRLSIEGTQSAENNLETWRNLSKDALLELQSGNARTERVSGFALDASTRIVLPISQLPAFDELVSSGQLNLISDPVLRNGIADQVGRIRSTEDYIALLRPNMIAPRAIIQARLDTVIDGEGDARAEFVPAQHVDDIELQRAIGDALRTSSVNQIWLDRIQDSLDDLEIMITGSLDSVSDSSDLEIQNEPS